jgi:hypothetical protein
MTVTAPELPSPGDPLLPDHPDALALAYQEVKDTRAYFLEWSDAVANRAVGLFGIASLIVALVPAFAELHAAGAWRGVWILALGCWAGASLCCFLALFPATLRVDPDPAALLDPRWLQLPAPWYHRYRLEEWAAIAAHNRPILRTKAGWLKRGLLLAGAEVLALAALVFHAN